MSTRLTRDTIEEQAGEFGFRHALSEQLPGPTRDKDGYVDTFVANDGTALLAHSDRAGNVGHLRVSRQIDGARHRNPALAVEDAAAKPDNPLFSDDLNRTVRAARAERDPRQNTTMPPGQVAGVSLDLPHDHARLYHARVFEEDASQLDRRATTKYDTAGITIDRARRMPDWARTAIQFADPAERDAAADMTSADQALAAHRSQATPNALKANQDTARMIANGGMGDPRQAEAIASELNQLARETPGNNSRIQSRLRAAATNTDAHAAAAVAEEVVETSPRATQAQRLNGLMRQWTDERMYGTLASETPHAPRDRNFDALTRHEDRLTSFSRTVVERNSGTTEAIGQSGREGRAVTETAKGALRYFANGQEITDPGEASKHTQPIGGARAEADTRAGALDTQVADLARRSRAYRDKHATPPVGPPEGRHAQMRLAAADLHGSARALDVRMQTTPERAAPDRNGAGNDLSVVRAWSKPQAALAASTGARAMRSRAMAAETGAKTRQSDAAEL